MSNLKTFQKSLPLIKCKEYVCGSFFCSLNISTMNLRVFSGSVPRRQSELALPFLGIFFHSYIEGPRRNKSIIEHFIDDFSRVSRVIKRRVTKSRSRALSCLYYGTQRTARRAVWYCRAENDNRSYVTSRKEKEKKKEGGERRREKERLSEWMARDQYEKYRLYATHASSIHPLFLPLCSLPFYSYVPSTVHLVDRTTHRVCMHARINKRSIHYL